MCWGEKLGQVMSARGPERRDRRASAWAREGRLLITAERIPVRTTRSVASALVEGISAIARRIFPSSDMVRLLGWNKRIAGDSSRIWL